MKILHNSGEALWSPKCHMAMHWIVLLICTNRLNNHLVTSSCHFRRATAPDFLLLLYSRHLANKSTVPLQNPMTPPPSSRTS